jgi:hypothetical protein
MNQAADVRSTGFALDHWLLPKVLCGIFVAYLVAMKLAIPMSLVDTILSTLANLVPVAVLGLATRYLVRRHLMARPPHVQIACHLALAVVFALLWYWALMVLLGLQAGHSWTSFEVRPIFAFRAIAWMLLQGLTFYALVVALTYLEARPSAASTAPAEANAPPVSRYFIKDADSIRPVDACQIISIRGAGDYAEVTTANGRHLARRTLADFQAMLEAERFLRVHRAAIVNLERIARAEPAGDGRMLIHMENGEAIQTSRAGAKLLRAHVI